MADDRRYEEFVESYSADAAVSVPGDWPEDLRRRCLFFVRMMQSDVDDEESPPVSELDEFTDFAPPLAEAADSPLALPSGEAERYNVERELSAGGTGRILLAFDRDFRRRIAMKVMRRKS